MWCCMLSSSEYRSSLFDVLTTLQVFGCMRVCVCVCVCVVCVCVWCVRVCVRVCVYVFVRVYTRTFLFMCTFHRLAVESMFDLS